MAFLLAAATANPLVLPGALAAYSAYAAYNWYYTPNGLTLTGEQEMIAAANEALTNDIAAAFGTPTTTASSDAASPDRVDTASYVRNPVYKASLVHKSYAEAVAAANSARSPIKSSESSVLRKPMQIRRVYSAAFLADLDMILSKSTQWKTAKKEKARATTVPAAVTSVAIPVQCSPSSSSSSKRTAAAAAAAAAAAVVVSAEQIELEADLAQLAALSVPLQAVMEDIDEF
jgi:hypothetical protein